MGANAVFRLADPSTKSANWNFWFRQPHLGFIHQRIYRNPRSRSEPRESNLDRLPAGDPCGPFPEWKEYFLPEQPSCSQYPSVAKFLKGRRRNGDGLRRPP